MRDPSRNTTYLKFMIRVPTPGGEKSYHVVRVFGSSSYRYEDGILVISCTTTISDPYTGNTEVLRAVRTIGMLLVAAGATFKHDTQAPLSVGDLPRRFYATAEATLSMVKVMEATYETYLDSSDFDGAVKEIFEDHFRKLHNAMWIKTVARSPLNGVTSDGYEALLRQHDVPHTLVAEEGLRRIMDVNKVRFEP